MNRAPDNADSWEVASLEHTIGDFLARHSPEEDRDAVRKLGQALARTTIEGGSHLSSEGVREQIGDRDPSALHAVGSAEGSEPLVLLGDGTLYLRRYFEYEQTLAASITQRVGQSPRPPTGSSGAGLGENISDCLDPGQQMAVGCASLRQFCMITGGPGTGKTRTIVGLLAFLLKNDPDLKVALAAPTGKAAFRMRDSILNSLPALNLPGDLHERVLACSKASTIHRLLGSIRGSVDFRRNGKNPLRHDLIIIDEASMVDLPLMAKLLSALRPETRVVLTGDADQLSPVQGGPVFNALARDFSPDRFAQQDVDALKELSLSATNNATNDDILAGCHVSLKYSHRQEGSAAAAISRLCQSIREGDADTALSILREDAGEGRLSWVENLDSSTADEAIRTGYGPFRVAVEPAQSLEAFSRFRILCAINLGRFGVQDWNSRAANLIQSKDPADGAEPIVITSNEYAVGLFNGDDGILRGNRAWFRGEEDLREVALSRLPRYLPAYATTIHRSQGSEYDKVLVILPPEESRILTRELLYVAVSRARSGVLLVGAENSLRAAINNSEPSTSGVPALLRK